MMVTVEIAHILVVVLLAYILGIWTGLSYSRGGRPPYW